MADIKGGDMLGVAIALGGALAGFLVAWGSLRATIAQLAKDVDELRREMKQLSTVVVRLTSQLAIHADREERDLASLLGRHASGGRSHLGLEPITEPPEDK
jgi:outer membrane murein-binding lipoprotein Lpp